MTTYTPTIWSMGWIEVICGSMFSGKTEELIRRINRAKIAKQKVQIFKPIIDDRYAKDQVVSHSSLKVEALNIRNPEEILSFLEDNTRVIAIDEVQFFPKSIIDIIQRLANRGLRVIVAGLDLDYHGVPFGPMPELLALAEMVTKTSAICSVCGNTASRTQKKNLDEASPVVRIGGDETYEARCRRCFEAPRNPS